MKSHVFHTAWCNIYGEAAGEIWNWSLFGGKGFKASGEDALVWIARFPQFAINIITPPRSLLWALSGWKASPSEPVRVLFKISITSVFPPFWADKIFDKRHYAGCHLRKAFVNRSSIYLSFEQLLGFVECSVACLSVSMFNCFWLFVFCFAGFEPGLAAAPRRHGHGCWTECAG